ncbi:MAG: methyltransferase domain-containing protein [Promethearchaeota archaeon]
MINESLLERLFQKEEFFDRKTSTSEEGVDVIIPLMNTNILFERSLISFYREIPINRLIIGDAGITDDSLDILKKFPRVKIVEQSKYISLGYCITELISLVETKWFIYLHSDVYLPENWYDNMKKYQNQYDWFECDSTNVVLIEFKRNLEKIKRAYSGSQMGRTKAFKNIISNIDDDFLYRNEDIIFQELILKEGFKYGRVFDTFHFHQIMNKKGKVEPKYKNVIIERELDEKWEKKTYNMQARGIIKYLLPKPYLIDSVNKALRVLQKHDALNIREFKQWVLKTNKAWLDHLFIEKKIPFHFKIINKFQQILSTIFNLLINKYNSLLDVKFMTQKQLKEKSGSKSNESADIKLNKKILDVGCGQDKVPGAIGIDIADLPGVDIVQDLNVFPWGDFEDETFDEIYMNDILEHLDDPIKVMRECHRLLKSGGKLHVRVVYWNHKYSFSDPTHKHAFSEISFTFFTGERRSYYMDFKFKDLKINYSFDPLAIKKFGKNKKKLLEKANFYCNVINGMNIILTK